MDLTVLLLCRNALSVSGWGWDTYACHCTIDPLSDWLYRPNYMYQILKKKTGICYVLCVNLQSFRPKKQHIFWISFWSHNFNTRKWACDIAKGICSVAPSLPQLIAVQLYNASLFYRFWLGDIQWQQYCTGCHAMVIVSRCVCCHLQNPWVETSPHLLKIKGQGSGASMKTIRRRSCLSCWYNHNQQRPTAGVCMRLSTDTVGWSLWSTRDMTSCTSTGRYPCWLLLHTMADILYQLS